MIAAGVGAAMFHLTTHASFKALLFLGSGSVIHGCHHEQDIFKMGGLRAADEADLRHLHDRRGARSSGCPFLAGLLLEGRDPLPRLANNRPVFAVLAFTAVLTALYMVRLWKIVFFGEPRSEAAAHAHEGGFTLWAPLVRPGRPLGRRRLPRPLSPRLRRRPGLVPEPGGPSTRSSWRPASRSWSSARARALAPGPPRPTTPSSAAPRRS